MGMHFSTRRHVLRQATAAAVSDFLVTKKELSDLCQQKKLIADDLDKERVISAEATKQSDELKRACESKEARIQGMLLELSVASSTIESSKSQLRALLERLGA